MKRLKFTIEKFKHVGKVYCLNIGDSFYTKCGSILKVENKTFDYIFTLSDGKNYTPNQVYSLIKQLNRLTVIKFLKEEM